MLRTLYNKWRYYTLEHDEYKSCMSKAYINNIIALRWANIVFFVMALLFSIFPVITEKNIIKASFYLGAAIVALCLFFISSNQNKKLRERKKINTKFINALVLLYYINVMFFGLYLAVWAEPEKIAGSFIGIIICVLFLFNISPLLYLWLTVILLAVYVTAIINVKIPSVWNYDIQNALFAGIMGLIFGWNIIMKRITMMSVTEKLKDENTIDELTKLRNRKDFMITFKRFLTNHRQTDNFLCIAIIDIDFFKNYNDHYGHPQGDECLRTIGEALNELKKSGGIYAARVGGEEFALLWNIENFADAERIGLKVNKLIRDLNIPHVKSTVEPFITVSVGIHVAPYGIQHNIDDLYNLADKALYTAKNNGRNRTVVSS
ncbi:MAG: GGDEF domain-containing protein [Treponema sp.]|nr:GGDEF domain-containing protein [Treponema sp.]MCL2251759.1 GGDEF domain-containing protein [Treponema sp.]